VLNVANLLKRHTGDTVILVTSASHMRRARVLLDEAFRQYDLDTRIVPVVALDAPSVEEAAKVSQDERLVIYRDLMRVSGGMGLSRSPAIEDVPRRWLGECRGDPPSVAANPSQAQPAYTP
jgi:hypothetical protein